jgi:Tfp pilus assembly PilM family ATPase
LHIWQRKRYSLGLDISEETGIWVELCRKGNHIEIVSVGKKSNIKKDDDQLITQWIKNAINKREIHSEKVHLAISSADTLKKTISVSHELNKSDIKILLAQEQSNYFSGIKESLLYDFVLLKDVEKKDKQKVLIIGARLSSIKRQMDILKKTKLQIHSIEPDSYALIRVLEHYFMNEVGQHKSFLLIDQKRNSLRVVIFDRNEVLLEKLFSLEKRNKLSCEIGDMVRQFQFENKHQGIEKIFLMQECSIQKDLKEMAERLNTNVCVIDENEKLNIQNNTLVAYGLALRGAYDCH